MPLAAALLLPAQVPPPLMLLPLLLPLLLAPRPLTLGDGVCLDAVAPKVDSSR